MDGLWRVVAGLTVAFAAGWQAASWQRDSVDLAVTRASVAVAEQARQALQVLANQSGAALESKLEALRNVPNKTVYREIVKPVFTNVCLSAEFVSLYNDAVNHTERVLSGKPEKEMSGQ